MHILNTVLFSFYLQGEFITESEWWRAYAWIINFETLYGGLNIAYLWSYIAWV